MTEASVMQGMSTHGGIIKTLLYLHGLLYPENIFGYLHVHFIIIWEVL